MNRTTGIIIALIIGLVLGYFAGREHIKYELRSALSSAAEGLSDAFSDDDSPAIVSGDRSSSQPAKPDPVLATYARDSLELYEFEAEYKESYSGRVAGVTFKLKNNGDRALDRVKVTVYFKNSDGAIIAEEDFLPVRVSDYNFSGDNKPLKPGYIWQLESNKFYKADQVPSEWQEGNAEASITEIRFAAAN